MFRSGAVLSRGDWLLQALGMTCVKEKHFAEAKFSLYFMQNLAEGVVSEVSHPDCADVHPKYFSYIAGAHSALHYSDLVLKEICLPEAEG